MPSGESPADFVLVEHFVHTVVEVGGRVLPLDVDAADHDPTTHFPEIRIMASTVPEVLGNRSLNEVQDPRKLSDLELLVCRAHYGVAENGAVWIDESILPHRAALFLAEHVSVVLNREDIVRTMHEAYARIDIGSHGYGVFVSGPSKTADIEQSLVIGAHGPRSLTILLA